MMLDDTQPQIVLSDERLRGAEAVVRAMAKSDVMAARTRRVVAPIQSKNLLNEFCACALKSSLKQSARCSLRVGREVLLVMRFEQRV